MLEWLESSVVDPDPHSFRSAGSGSRRAKKTHKREELSSFEVLDLLFYGMKTSPVVEAWG
jgi:hypothetical protein